MQRWSVIAIFQLTQLAFLHTVLTSSVLVLICAPMGVLVVTAGVVRWIFGALLSCYLVAPERIWAVDQQKPHLRSSCPVTYRAHYLDTRPHVSQGTYTPFGYIGTHSKTSHSQLHSPSACQSITGMCSFCFSGLPTSLYLSQHCATVLVMTILSL